jgi:hypothetical protein
MFENPNAPAGKPRLADGVSDDLVRHYREGNRDGDKFEKPLANSFALFAIFALGAAVWHADRNRHKLLMTGKFRANCDLTFATDRCSDLTEL